MTTITLVFDCFLVTIILYYCITQLLHILALYKVQRLNDSVYLLVRCEMLILWAVTIKKVHLVRSKFCKVDTVDSSHIIRGLVILSSVRLVFINHFNAKVQHLFYYTKFLCYYFVLSLYFTKFCNPHIAISLDI